MFSVLTSKIYGGLSIALALCLGVLWLAKNSEIAEWEGKYNVAENARLRLAVDVAQCRTNNGALQLALERQNAATDATARLAKEVAAKGSAALVQAQAGNKAVEAKIKAIDATSRTGDDCKDADALITEQLK